MISVFVVLFVSFLLLFWVFCLVGWLDLCLFRFEVFFPYKIWFSFVFNKMESVIRGFEKEKGWTNSAVNKDNHNHLNYAGIRYHDKLTSKSILISHRQIFIAEKKLQGERWSKAT